MLLAGEVDSGNRLLDLSVEDKSSPQIRCANRVESLEKAVRYSAASEAMAEYSLKKGRLLSQHWSLEVPTLPSL